VVVRHFNFKQYFTDTRLLLCVFLGFSSGLPLKLAIGIVGLWLAREGVDIQTIGLFSVVSAPYTFKFAWAPMLDRWSIPWLGRRLGRRRSWMLVTQVLLIAAISGLGLTRPTISVMSTALITLALTTFSATQDVAVDAWRVETFETKDQGSASAATVLGYRLGMLWGAAFMLRMVSGLEAWPAFNDLLASYGLATGEGGFNAWNATWFMMGWSMLVGVAATLVAREPEHEARDETGPFWESIIGPARSIAAIPSWGFVLLFVFSYKLSDVLAGTLISPFLVESGYTLIQIADVRDVLGLVASIGGAVLGGILVTMLGTRTTLVVGAIAMMVSNLAFAALLLVPGSVPGLAIVIVFENLSGGAATSAFVAYLASLCSPKFAATQYAWLTSLAALARTLLGSTTGKIVAAVGWGPFFCATAVASVPALAFLWAIEKNRPRSITVEPNATIDG
jgi:PAT family beta-lactamase induction signal transducer AmpG